MVMSPVAVEVAPHAMNVIRVVLGIIVLNQKGAALDAVVMSLAFFEATHPCELDEIESGLANLVQPAARLRLWLSARCSSIKAIRMPC